MQLSPLASLRRRRTSGPKREISGAHCQLLMAGTSARPVRKSGGDVRKRGDSPEEIVSLLTALGMKVTGSDVRELGGFFRMGKDQPSEILRNLPELAQFFSRTIPNSAIARERLGRLLEGVEYLVRAARTVVASDDPDLIRGLQTALADTAEDFFPAGVDRSKLDTTEIGRALLVRIGSLVARIPNSRDPRVQEAVILLFRAGQTLNPLVELPTLPAADTVEVNVDDLAAKKPKRRRKTAK